MRTGVTAVAGVLALAFPAGALAHGPAHATHAKPAKTHAKAVKPAAKTHGKGQAKRHVPEVAIVAKGTVVSVDTTAGTAVMTITSVNHHGLGLAGQQVTVDLSKAELSVADVNGDGQANLADVAAGDTLVLQGRVPLLGASTTFTVARAVDQTHPAGESEGSSGSTTTDSGSTTTDSGSGSQPSGS